MLVFVIVTLFFAVILFADIFADRKSKKQFLIKLLFACAGYLILSLACFDIYVPSPLKPIEYMIKMYFNP